MLLKEVLLYITIAESGFLSRIRESKLMII